MPDTPVRVALVGCGAIGQIHADGLAKLVADGTARAIVAADPDPGARALVGRNCAFERFTDDGLEAIAAGDVDAVMITAPTRFHLDLVRAASEAGKPILCEKPLARDLGSAEEMVRMVRSSGVVAQVGLHSRFHPLVSLLRDQLDGRLGRPMSYAARDDQFWPTGSVVTGHSSWRSDRRQAGGGTLLEHSIHLVDIILHCFGPIRGIFAITRNVFGYDVEDSAVLTIEHESGVTGSVVTIFNGVEGREERRLEVFLERGTIEATTNFVVGAPEDSFLIQQPGRPAERPDLAALRDRYFAALGITRRDFVFYQYVADRAWVRSVQSGTPAIPSFPDALAAHRVVDAAYRSAESGRPVHAGQSGSPD